MFCDNSTNKEIAFLLHVGCISVTDMFHFSF